MWDMSFCYNSLMRLISATHAHVHADEQIDADSLFVDVKNDLKHTTRTVDNALLGQEHPENLVSTDSFDPLLCKLGLEQLSCEMACKSLCAEIAHETTISILDKFSSYYFWEANAVLAALEVFPLNYKYFLAPAQFHSSHQDVESVEIPKHVPATLKHLDLQKYMGKISELNKVINDVLDLSASVFELKKLFTDNYIYCIIVTVVACTTQMCCLTSEKDKTQDLSLLAFMLSSLKNRIRREQSRIEKKKAKMKLKELLQTPDEIVEVFKGLIFAKDDKQSLFDGSTKEMVSVDVLKEKNALLFISSLNISSDDISTLIPIYIGIRKKKDKFKIVWIPIVEQDWTDELRMKFEMLQSDMPWYIVQYFSPIAGIKFIKEEWHFDNEPIVVVLNSQGDVKNKDALGLIRRGGVDALAAGRDQCRPESAFTNPRGPHQNEVCTFYCGGKDKRWIKQFCEKFNAVAKDPLIDGDGNLFVTLFYVGKCRKLQHFDENIQKLLRPFKLEHFDEDIQELLRPFKKERRWAVFMNGFNEVISKDRVRIVTFLERFEQWKGNVRTTLLETCFKGLLQTGSLPSTSV